jgi:hypothetical protein
MKYLLIDLYYLFAKRANALLASAILYTSSFFLKAVPDSFAASISSDARNLWKAAPFLLRAAQIIHLAARNNCLFGFTSEGT